MVTTHGESVINHKPHSEYHAPLHTNDDLKSDTDALFVDGIGPIAQYHKWSDMMYSHGFVYYLRDRLLCGPRSIDHEQRLASLNSKIRLHEQSQCQ